MKKENEEQPMHVRTGAKNVCSRGHLKKMEMEMEFSPLL
jgi:hypothetical protein